MNTPIHGIDADNPVVASRRSVRVGSLRTLITVALATVGALATLALVAAGPASASTVNAVATIVDPSTSAFLPSGASTTPFTVALPANAECTGDTATDGYHVYSYLVPEGTNLSTVTFINFPSVGFGFVNNIGTYYGPANTAPTTGEIIGIPDFEWAPLVTDDGVSVSTLTTSGTTPGTWEAGLACATSSGVLSDNWNTEVTFTANSSDPTGFVWSAVPGPSGNQLPAITSADNTTFTVGSDGTFPVTATGTPTPTLSETGTLPNGVSFNATTGVLSGTPAAGTAASYPISFTATNGIGTPATQSFTLTVNAATNAPAITSADNTSFIVGTAGTFPVTATGTPTPTLSETGPLPNGVSFDATTGVLSGTPAAGTAASYSISFTASNGVGTPATQSFTLTVNQVAAITSVNHATFTAGTLGTFTVTATGSPAPTFSETGTLPNGVSLNSTSGVLSGTPAAGSGGAYPITLTATNGIATPATQSFTLTVDQAPAITSANTTTFTVGSAGTFTVAASGFPVPTYSETGPLPSGVTLSTAGVLSGTPAAGTAGSYPITITGSNGIGTNATQSFTLGVQIPPLAISTTSLPAATVGTAYSETLAATGGTAPYLWSVSSGTLPAGLALDATTGLISGTPTAVGSSTFTAEVTDTEPATVTRQLSISVVTAVIPPNPGTLPGGSASGVTATPDGKGYWLINAAGDVSPHGSAQSFGSLSGVPLNAPIVDLVSTPDGQGYWLVAADGGVFAFGDAPFLGSMGGQRLNAPVVGAATTGTGQGYWLVAADGGVFAFGDAPFLGSMGGQVLNAPVVGAATTGNGQGYWLVAADGGVFAFGDAPFLGSMGGQTLNKPVVGIATNGQGYWLAASDGGVFTFGDAPFLGSAAGYSLSGPVVSIAAGGTGYWLASSGGGIYTFGQNFYGGG